MAEAREMRFWDGISWLIVHMPTMSKKKRKAEDFHPIRKRRAKVHLQRLEQQMKEFSAKLPPTVTDEEFEARYQKHLASGR